MKEKKMHILGTGTAVVSKYVNTACVFDDGESLFLVDGTGGTDVLRCFDRMNLDWNRLHHGFLSHEHNFSILVPPRQSSSAFTWSGRMGQGLFFRVTSL